MVALHNTPRYSREIDYMGFLGKKKTPKGAYALFCHADFILACCTKFLILFFMIRSMICDPIRDLIRDPIRDLIRDPVCDPICKLKSF